MLWNEVLKQTSATSLAYSFKGLRSLKECRRSMLFGLKGTSHGMIMLHHDHGTTHAVERERERERERQSFLVLISQKHTLESALRSAPMRRNIGRFDAPQSVW